jgi:hypothetical protein
MIAINDPPGGGDNYAFDDTCHAEADIKSALAPFFDDERARQDAVRKSYQSQNGRGSYTFRSSSVIFRHYSMRLPLNCFQLPASISLLILHLLYDTSAQLVGQLTGQSAKPHTPESW